MRPGNGERTGPLPGYRPVGSPRNGLDLGVKPYRFRGQPGWDPAKGVHLDPAVVTPKPARTPLQSLSRAERLAEYCAARDLEFTKWEAAELVGVASETAGKYEREYQARAAQAAGSAS